MGKEAKSGARSPENYGELVDRLESVVKQLETGELTLEESLKAFEEGVGLVTRGEKLLTEAERRIEQLLEQGGQDQAVPLDEEAEPSAPATKAAVRAKAPGAEEDVPF